MARKGLSACFIVSVGVADTSSLVLDITEISYSLFLSLPKNFAFVLLNLFADSFFSSLPTSENFTGYFRVSQRSGPALLRQFVLVL